MRAGDHNEAASNFRIPGGEYQRDTAAERMAANDNALQSKLVDNGAKVARQFLRRVLAVRSAAVAMPALVGRVDRKSPIEMACGHFPHPAIAGRWMQQDQIERAAGAVKTTDGDALVEHDIICLEDG